MFVSIDEVTGEWRKPHNEELHDLYSLPSVIRLIKSKRIRWTGHVARMGEKGDALRLLLGKPERRRPLGRPRHRWLDNIWMDLVQLGWSDVDWIGLAQDKDRWRALVNSVLNLRVPYNAGKLSSVQTTRDISSSAELHRVSQLVSSYIYLYIYIPLYLLGSVRCVFYQKRCYGSVCGCPYCC
jgi:hypothetical protein